MSNITEDRNKQQEDILDLLFEELDISDAKYQEAEDHYKALGDWLSRPDSKVALFSPKIYVQGSFRLGTVIKPISAEGEYDIDSVCELDLKTSNRTQKQLKELVGFEVTTLAAHAYNNEADTVQALRNIVDTMLNSIEHNNDILWIPNPVNPLENFADKWPAHPQLQENFFKWCREVKAHLDKLLGPSSGIQNFSESMTKIAGTTTAHAVMKRYGSNIAEIRGKGLLKATGGAATLGVGLGGTTVLGHTFYGK